MRIYKNAGNIRITSMVLYRFLHMMSSRAIVPFTVMIVVNMNLASNAEGDFKTLN